MSIIYIFPPAMIMLFCLQFLVPRKWTWRFVLVLNGLAMMFLTYWYISAITATSSSNNPALAVGFFFGLPFLLGAITGTLLQRLVSSFFLESSRFR
jgi:hypothetical protein